jgi:hypothetical protein
MAAKKDIHFYLKKIKKIKDGMQILTDNRVNALKFYRCDPEILESREGQSNATTTDLQDAINWVKPSLLEIFTASDSIASIEPASEKDVPAADQMNLLVNQQLQQNNNWFLVMNDWIDSALLMKFGAIKYQWFVDTQVINKDYEGLTDQEYQAKLNEEGVEVVAHTERILNQQQVFQALQMGMMPPPPIKEHDISIKKTSSDEYPLIESVPPEDLGFPIDARDLSKVAFMYHRIQYEKWEFIKQFGKSDIDDLENLKDDKSGESEVSKERLSDLGGKDFFYDSEKSEFIVYECYVRDSETGDAKIVYICGDKLLKEMPNKYIKPPFVIISPIKISHRIIGYSLYDLLREVQLLRTAMLRQIMDNLYFANNRRYFGDTNRINVDDYLNNNFPGALIRVDGDPNTVVMAEQKAPLPNEVFTFWEMLLTEKDYHSGIPRSFQGVEKNELNKTWRGASGQIAQAAQRVKLMARIIAEMGVTELVSDIIDLNTLFLKKKTSVKYLGNWVDIDPDTIIGNYNVVVNVALGDEKSQTITFMQQLLGLYGQLSKSGANVVSPINVFNAMKELVKAMGFRNVQDFVTSPSVYDGLKNLLAMIAQKGMIQDPQIAQLAEQVGIGFGLIQPPPPGQPPPGKGANGGQQFPGQQPPVMPALPANSQNPVVTPDALGFFG